MVPIGDRADGKIGDGPLYRRWSGPIRLICALIAGSIVCLLAVAIVKVLT